MKWYLDSSVLVHALLPDGDPRARTWLETVRRHGDAVYSSALLELEMVRVLRRERLDAAVVGAAVKRVALVSIDDGILRIAAAIEPHVKALDAIHLATCSLLGSCVTIATHDSAMSSAAASLGFDVVDPLG